MWIASYTFTVPVEERTTFLDYYRSFISEFIEEQESVSEIHFLDILTVIDPSAASFSLQIHFKTEANFEVFAESVFPVILKLLNVQLPNKYAYFHTLLKRI